MPRKQPKYMLHKPLGQARVRIGGRDIYLGEYDSPESHEQYYVVIAKFLTGRLDENTAGVSISRLSIAFVAFAKGYYLKDGEQTAEVSCIQMALTVVLRNLIDCSRKMQQRPRRIPVVDGLSVIAACCSK